MGKKLEQMIDKGWAELAAYGRYGLKDLQARVLGELGGTTPTEAGMLGAPTQAQITQQLEPDQVMTYEAFQQQQAEAAQSRPPEQAAEKPPEPEPGDLWQTKAKQQQKEQEPELEP